MGIKDNTKRLFVEFIDDIVKGYKQMPKRIVLWNVAITFILLGSYFYSTNWFIFFQTVGSMIAFGTMVDRTTNEKNVWMVGTAFVWCMLALLFIIGIGIFIYSNTIEKFFEWLDTREFKKQFEKK